MNKKYIMANWKMNKSRVEAEKYLQDLERILCERVSNHEIIVFPPSLYLDVFLKNTKKVQYGVQNFYPEEQGAYTGEISLSMLENKKPWVMVGHSERRILFAENDTFISKKLHVSIKCGFRTVYCIGENREEKESGKTEEVLVHQLSFIKGVKMDDALSQKLVIAYEPVWSIGTGKIPSLLEIEERHMFTKNYLEKLLATSDKKIYTLYGGSVSSANSNSILNVKGVDGVLVGNASLDFTSFVDIIYT
ncbi:MAG: triose-phosphate isomerase [Desulfovibrionaceae bacterium]